MKRFLMIAVLNLSTANALAIPPVPPATEVLKLISEMRAKYPDATVQALAKVNRALSPVAMKYEKQLAATYNVSPQMAFRSAVPEVTRRRAGTDALEVTAYVSTADAGKTGTINLSSQSLYSYRVDAMPMTALNWAPKKVQITPMTAIDDLPGALRIERSTIENGAEKSISQSVAPVAFRSLPNSATYAVQSELKVKSNGATYLVKSDGPTDLVMTYTYLGKDYKTKITPAIQGNANNYRTTFYEVEGSNLIVSVLNTQTGQITKTPYAIITSNHLGQPSLSTSRGETVELTAREIAESTLVLKALVEPVAVRLARQAGASAPGVSFGVQPAAGGSLR